MQVAAFLLLGLFAVVAIAASIVYKDYRRLYAQTHHDDAPVLAYLFEHDPDAGVEAARVRSNRLALLSLAVAILFAAVIALGRQPAA